MTPTRPDLRGAAIGVMCAERQHEILLGIRSCGGHAILLDEFGIVRGARTPITAAALVIDVNHPKCNEALETAAASGMPVVAWAVSTPPPDRRDRLKTLKIPLLLEVDADALCRALAAAIGRHERPATPTDP